MNERIVSAHKCNQTGPLIVIEVLFLALAWVLGRLM